MHREPRVDPLVQRVAADRFRNALVLPPQEIGQCTVRVSDFADDNLPEIRPLAVDDT